MDDSAAIDARRKFVEAWNETMVNIWTERIFRLGVRDTDALYHSVKALQIRADADGKFHSFELSEEFLEYGLWQDLGVGRNTKRGNTHRRDNDGWTNKREPRRWFSTKYYSSVMNLRDFMAESLGDEFKSMFARLDADDLRRNSAYYKKKGIV
jgi:hypothetical protein